MLLPGALRRHPTLARHLDRWSLRLPGVGEARQKIILARFASELAMLFSAGVPLLDSLRISEAVLDNRELQAGVAAARQRIAQGGGLADSFALTGMFPSLALRMLRIGETTGELARALDNVSYFYRRDAQDAIDRVLALVEPALTALLGLLLLWIISAVMAPVYDALSQLGQRT
jgi:type IV pilus assembly protein PilC